MKRNIITGFLALSLMLWASIAVATPLHDPTPNLQTWANDMISALQKNKASIRKNPQEVYDIVNNILVPHCDVNLMARLALGRNAWLNATPAEKQAFIPAFQSLMQRTYASGLSSYTDESVKFFPIRGGMAEGQNRVEVKSEILRNDGPNIAVNYRLIFQKGDWYVYDFCVEGVCMIDSFRSQFAADLSSGVTVSELIKKLNTHNTKTH